MEIIDQYFKNIKKNVDNCYIVARDARRKGLDPAADVEIFIATTLADKAVGLVSTMYPQISGTGISERISELESEYGKLHPAVSFKIAEEVAKEKFCKFESLLQAIEAGVRIGFAYNTLGIVSAPLEGFTSLKLGKTNDGKDYFRAYFSGPIRAAGTTANCVLLMLIDYLRELFGFAKFDPDENEVRRYVSEIYTYHERVTNLQYLPTEEEIIFLAKNLPIQIDGEPSERKEVLNHKDLPRVETNFIRGGMCLVFSEGLAQKAQKGLRLLRNVQDKSFEATGWNYLDDYIELHKKREKGAEDVSPTYIKDIVAGRPVFSYPSRSGGFRFRYGRGRTGGFSATLVHPATMALSGNFLSNGSQLRLEKPTKGCAITVCDEIEGPIVKMNDGSVRRVKSFEEGEKIYGDVKEILYLGDLLFPLDDVMNRNFELLRPGYVEEWWALELEKMGGQVEDKYNISLDEAVKISKEYKIPLHPAHILFWTEINNEEFISLLDWLKSGMVENKELRLPWVVRDRDEHASGKRALELLGVEHRIERDKVLLDKNFTEMILFNLGINIEECDKSFEEKISSVGSRMDMGEKSVLNIINKLCECEIKDRAGSFIGARMGRPEKAKLRKLPGSPHVLFPLGEYGGRMKAFDVAVNEGVIEGFFPNFFCDKCDSETIYPQCEVCGNTCRKGEENYSEKKIDIKNYYDIAKKISGVEGGGVPIKGVRNMNNEDRSVENISKGFLRAKHGLHVNKDGTIRYDMTEMAITHFKPKEIGTGVDKLKELGYIKDISGNILKDDNQILELFPHDIILPSAPDSPDERADDVFFTISKFIDDELENIYGLPRFYRAESKDDIVGALVACIAPHICTTTVGRIIGFSKTQTMLASPFMHAAMRRDCDGDEAAVILLMDALLNFSRKFLPAHRGGTQDAPLVLNIKIDAGDVDDQILDLVLEKYPLSLYELAEKGAHSSEVKIETVKTRLANEVCSFSNIGYTHECSDINLGVTNSSYKNLPTMQEKVEAQMKLCKMLRAVDVVDVARLLIERHYIRDIRGNLRKFSMQAFRCARCNEKYRRPPLTGKCSRCGDKLVFTVAEGSVTKYMKPALKLARDYGVSKYLLESLELTEMYIQSVFGMSAKKEEIHNWL